MRTICLRRLGDPEPPVRQRSLTVTYELPASQSDD